MKPRKPLPRKRARPRTRRWQCKFCPTLNAGEKKKCTGCGIRRAAGRKSATKTADELWAELVKAGGRCQGVDACVLLLGFDPKSGRQIVASARIVCTGRLEAAHIVPRRHQTTRWDPANGRALCRAHHAYFTDHEKAWRDFIGPEWDRLWVQAQERWDGTYPITELRAALARLKEAA